MIHRQLFSITLVSLTSFAAASLNPKGPRHVAFATSCLENIARENFFYLDDIGKQHESFDGILLLTILTTFDLSAPGYEVQQSSIKSFFSGFCRWTVEVVDGSSPQTRFGVQDEIMLSASKALEEQDQEEEEEEEEADSEEFVPIVKSNFYFMVTDSSHAVSSKLKYIEGLQSYNPKGIFLVYFSRLERDVEGVANSILQTFARNLIYNVMVVMPVTLRTFGMYSLKFSCPRTGVLERLGKCEEGALPAPSSATASRRYFQDRLGGQFPNCVMDVVAIKIEPFVFNETDGFEIELLQIIGGLLGLDLNVTVMDEQAWGTKEDGEWAGGLGVIYNGAGAMGIGNIAPIPDYMADFDFTTSHFTENLVWVVPIAQFVPKWRVLTIIFDWKLWLVCAVLIVASAVLLSISSSMEPAEIAYRREYGYFRSLHNNLFISLQILITAAIFKHPISDLTRIFFVGLAIFSIIISSVYTSSLVKYLTDPQREHQISSFNDILSSDLGIVGFETYRAIFNSTEDEKSMEVYSKYKVQDDNDDDWLRPVADFRNSCTIYSEVAINFMLGQSFKNSKEPKVFVIHKKIFQYSLAMAFKKGDPILNKITHIVQHMLAGGLIRRMSRKYTDDFKKFEAHENDSAELQKLSVDHLQGAFAILVFGYASGSFVLLLECWMKLAKKKKKNRRK